MMFAVRKVQAKKCSNVEINSSNILTSVMVCNDQIDCLYHDDEIFCELKSLQGPISCSCLIYAIVCENLPNNTLPFHVSHFYISVSIFKSKINSLDIHEHKFKNIKFLQLPRNHLNLICLLSFLKYLILLDIAHNYIMEVKQNCFFGSKYLMSIFLNSNDIIYLHQNAFHNLHQLKFLDLSSNPFAELTSNCFSNLRSLKVLNLYNNKFTNIRANSFSSTNVKLIRNRDYKISCMTSVNTFYTSYPPWYISCSDILPRTSMNIMYISISILTIFLNILSISLHVLKIQNIKINQQFQIIVIGMNFSDNLCGIYLTVIWTSDIILRGVYLINDNLWKSHPLCFTGLCIVLWFTMCSQMMMLYFSFSRLRAVKDPLKIKWKSDKKIIYQVSVIHAFSFGIALVLTLVFQFIERQLPTSLCLPFIDPSGSSTVTKIVSWVVIVSQSICAVSITVMQSLLVKKVNKSKTIIEKQNLIQIKN